MIEEKNLNKANEIENKIFTFRKDNIILSSI